MKRTLKLPAWNDRRGAILVMSAVLMTLIFAFLAFTIDVGHMTITKSELQNTADAAALGAIMELSTSDAATIQTAKDMAELNFAAGSPVMLADSDVEIGLFDFETKSFVTPSAAPNAVRVTARVEDEPYFFAPVMGEQSFNMEAQATAMLNPRISCSSSICPDP